jgi:hypothetical protein
MSAYIYKSQTLGHQELAKPQSQIQNIYLRKGKKKNQGAIFLVLIWKYESPVLQ